MKKLSIVSAVFFSTFCIHAQTKPIVVKVNEVKADVQPTMWGVFFEDINLGADGGLYAELVKNRSFEFFKPLMGWTVQQKQEGEVMHSDVNSLGEVMHPDIRSLDPRN